MSMPSTAASCAVRLIAARTAFGSRVTSWPATRAVPPSGASSVARMRTVVVFPAPFGPSSASTSPGWTCRSMPFSTRVSPKAFVSPSTSIVYAIHKSVRHTLLAWQEG